MTAAAPSVGVPLPPRPGRLLRMGRTVRYYVPAIMVFIGVIVLWELAVRGFGMQAFILPAPSAIGAALVENWGAGRWPLFEAARVTLFEAVGGLLIGTTVGLIVAFGIARWATARDAVLPFAIAANAIPIIAIAPIFNAWFGITNPLSKMMIAALLVFFPIMINVTRGLTQVEPSALELMRSYAASDWEILRKLRLPNALPYFLTALKVATTLSLIGAIVGEYFGGASNVIGRVVVQSASALRFDVTWAAILLGAITGIAFYLAIVALERVLIPWHSTVRGEHPG
ncbi:MAG: ABC transporter permease [Chloroflexi bacterium]|nr:ABC transporter permease [Chloroflexota bacterium]